MLKNSPISKNCSGFKSEGVSLSHPALLASCPVKSRRFSTPNVIIGLKEESRMGQPLVCLVVHMMFSTKRTFPLNTGDLQPPLYSYMGTVLRSHNSWLLSGRGTADHVHFSASIGKLSDAIQTSPSGNTAPNRLRPFRRCQSHCVVQSLLKEGDCESVAKTVWNLADSLLDHCFSRGRIRKSVSVLIGPANCHARVYRR